MPSLKSKLDTIVEKFEVDRPHPKSPHQRWLVVDSLVVPERWLMMVGL